MKSILNFNVGYFTFSLKLCTAMFDNIHLKHLKFKHVTLALLKQQKAKQVISVHYTKMEFRLLSGKNVPVCDVIL